MKQLKRSYVRSARLLFALLLACMIAGSIYDFQISSFLYPGKESSFGQFFAAFGELPAFLALICAGVLLFRHRGCLRRDWNVLFLIGAFGLIFGGIFLSWILSKTLYAFQTRGSRASKFLPDTISILQ